MSLLFEGKEIVRALPAAFANADTLTHGLALVAARVFTLFAASPYELHGSYFSVCALAFVLLFLDASCAYRQLPSQHGR